MASNTYSGDLEALSERISVLSKRLACQDPSSPPPPTALFQPSATPKPQDPIMDGLQNLKNQLSSMHVKLLASQEIRDKAATAKFIDAQAGNLIPTGPVFWQLFQTLRTDVHSLSSRVSTVERGLSDLEDRVDSLEPTALTPASSAAPVPAAASSSGGRDLHTWDFESWKQSQIGKLKPISGLAFCGENAATTTAVPLPEILPLQYAMTTVGDARLRDIALANIGLEMIDDKLAKKDATWQDARPDGERPSSQHSDRSVPLEGVAFRDQEIDRMDEQLKVLSERCRVSDIDRARLEEENSKLKNDNESLDSGYARLVRRLVAEYPQKADVQDELEFTKAELERTKAELATTTSYLKGVDDEYTELHKQHVQTQTSLKEMQQMMRNHREKKREALESQRARLRQDVDYWRVEFEQASASIAKLKSDLDAQRKQVREKVEELNRVQIELCGVKLERDRLLPTPVARPPEPLEKMKPFTKLPSAFSPGPSSPFEFPTHLAEETSGALNVKTKLDVFPELPDPVADAVVLAGENGYKYLGPKPKATSSTGAEVSFDGAEQSSAGEGFKQASWGPLAGLNPPPSWDTLLSKPYNSGRSNYIFDAYYSQDLARDSRPIDVSTCLFPTPSQKPPADDIFTPFAFQYTGPTSVDAPQTTHDHIDSENAKHASHPVTSSPEVDANFSWPCNDHAMTKNAPPVSTEQEQERAELSWSSPLEESRFRSNTTEAPKVRTEDVAAFNPMYGRGVRNNTLTAAAVTDNNEKDDFPADAMRPLQGPKSKHSHCDCHNPVHEYPYLKRGQNSQKKAKRPLRRFPTFPQWEQPADSKVADAATTSSSKEPERRDCAYNLTSPLPPLPWGTPERWVQPLADSPTCMPSSSKPPAQSSPRAMAKHKSVPDLWRPQPHSYVESESEGEQEKRAEDWTMRTVRRPEWKTVARTAQD